MGLPFGLCLFELLVNPLVVFPQAFLEFPVQNCDPLVFGSGSGAFSFRLCWPGCIRFAFLRRGALPGLGALFGRRMRTVFGFGRVFRGRFRLWSRHPV